MQCSKNINITFSFLNKWFPLNYAYERIYGGKRDYNYTLIFWNNYFVLTEYIQYCREWNKWLFPWKFARSPTFHSETLHETLVLVEQIKGPEEVRERIVAAARTARQGPDCPPELRPEYNPSQHPLCDHLIQYEHISHNGII